jgi:hypothetical protein
MHGFNHGFKHGISHQTTPAPSEGRHYQGWIRKLRRGAGAPVTVDYPSVKIDLEERTSTGVVEGVAAGLAEIGICSDDVETGRLQRLPYRKVLAVEVLIEGARRGNRIAAEGSDRSHRLPLNF